MLVILSLSKRIARKIIFVALLLALAGLIPAYWLRVPKTQGALKWEKTGEFADSTVIYSMTTYNNKLYAGGNAKNYVFDGRKWTSIVRDDVLVTNTYALAVWNNELYALMHDDVYRYDGGDKWTIVFGQTGYTICDCKALVVFDECLYLVVGGYGGMNVFEYNGTSWTNVSGPWDSNNHGLCAISYKGYLFVGTQNTVTGAEVWRYDGLIWEQVNQDGFGNADCECLSFAIYNNKLYASTGNSPTRGKVYCYNSRSSWTKVSSNGLGSDYNYAVSSLASYSGKLYAGTCRLNNNPGCEIWSYNGSSWVKENANGFGDASNTEAKAMTVFNNRLYVSTSGATAKIWATDGTPYLPPTTYNLYLAEGSTAWGFSCYISIENPNNSECHAEITYMDPHPETGRGRVYKETITLPPLSQTTIDPRLNIGDIDFSTLVICKEGKPIAVDRTMTWNYGQGEEAHSSIGVTSPSTTWYLPEGSSAHGFETWTLVQNPNAQEASVTLTYMTEGKGPIVVEKKIPGYSRATYNMVADIGEADSSIKVTSDIPVIAERAMYRNNRREGHCSIGATTPASDYYLAEGAVGWDAGFETWVLIQNPNDKWPQVSLTFMTQNGEVKGPSFIMAPYSRQSLKLNKYLQTNTDVSTHVHGNNPIIAERAMYWTSSGQEVCHDSIGMDSAHTVFYLPDGQTSEGRETWTLVQNPNSTSVQVEISYLTPKGQGNVTKTETIPANSRKTFNMLSHSGIQGRAAILVISKTSGKKIMVERAMYWNSRGAGTETIGGYSDIE